MNAKAVTRNTEQGTGPSSKDFAKLAKLIERAVEKFDGADTADSLKEKVLADLEEDRAGILARHFLGSYVLSSIENGLKAHRVQARQLHFAGLEQIELIKDGTYSHQGSKLKIEGKFVHAVGASPEQWRAKATMFETKLDAKATKKARECRLYAELLEANRCNSIAELSAKKKLTLVSPTPLTKSAGV